MNHPWQLPHSTKPEELYRSPPEMPNAFERHWHRLPLVLHRKGRNSSMVINDVPHCSPHVQVLPVFTQLSATFRFLWRLLFWVIGEVMIPVSSEICFAKGSSTVSMTLPACRVWVWLAVAQSWATWGCIPLVNRLYYTPSCIRNIPYYEIIWIVYGLQLQVGCASK